MDEQLIRVQHDDGYPAGFTLVDNRDIWTKCDRERKLALRPATLGVYVAMRSLPRGWEFREPWLMEHLKLGRDALRHAIRDLEATNRLTREVVRDAQGRYIRTVWTLHRAGTNPLTGFPSPEYPTAGEPHCRKIRTRVNRERASNTELITTTTDPELIWPPQLDQEDGVVILERFGEQKLETRWRQAILDEYAGLHLIGKAPKRRIAWMFAMIERTPRGEFVPDAGLQVAKDRARRAREAEEQTADREAAARATERAQDPQERLKRQAKMAKIAAEVIRI